MLSEKELVQKNVEKLLYYVDCMKNELISWRNEVSDDVVSVVENVVGKDVVEKLSDPYELSLIQLFGIVSSVIIGLDRELIGRFKELQDKLGNHIRYVEDVTFYCREIFETLIVVQLLYRRYEEWVSEVIEELDS